MAPPPRSSDEENKFEDLSGVQIKPGEGENPYDALINACNDSPVSRTPLYLRLDERQRRGEGPAKA